MTVTFDPVQLLIGGAAVVVAIGLLARKLQRLDRVLHAAAAIVQRELNQEANPDAVGTVVRRELQPNGGKSMKDDVTGLSVAVGWLGRGFDDLRADFDNHLREHHQETT